MPTKETIRCPTCGLQVERMPNGANATLIIDMAAYAKTCRVKDQPAFSVYCPNLKSATDNSR
jgi:hypothetical protein